MSIHNLPTVPLAPATHRRLLLAVTAPEMRAENADKDVRLAMGEVATAAVRSYLDEREVPASTPRPPTAADLEALGAAVCRSDSGDPIPTTPEGWRELLARAWSLGARPPGRSGPMTRFPELVSALLEASRGGDGVAFADAYEALFESVGLDPRAPGPPAPAPTCSAIHQWGEPACRLHGTAVARPSGAILCPVSGDVIVAPAERALHVERGEPAP